MEQAEGLLRSLQDRILQIESRRHKVSQLVQDLSHQVGLTLTLALHLHQHPQCTASALSCPPPQKQQSAQMRESFCKAQNALQSCDHQVAQLRAQLEEALRQVTAQQRVQDG